MRAFVWHRDHGKSQRMAGMTLDLRIRMESIRFDGVSAYLETVSDYEWFGSFIVQKIISNGRTNAFENPFPHFHKNT
jgi:hypothetical protein